MNQKYQRTCARAGPQMQLVDNCICTGWSAAGILVCPFSYCSTGCTLALSPSSLKYESFLLISHADSPLASSLLRRHGARTIGVDPTSNICLAFADDRLPGGETSRVLTPRRVAELRWFLAPSKGVLVALFVSCIFSLILSLSSYPPILLSLSSCSLSPALLSINSLVWVSFSLSLLKVR